MDSTFSSTIRSLPSHRSISCMIGEEPARIEGGDQLVLSQHVLAIGISQRTEVHSIEKIAENIFQWNRHLNIF